MSGWNATCEGAVNDVYVMGDYSPFLVESKNGEVRMIYQLDNGYGLMVSKHGVLISVVRFIGDPYEDFRGIVTVKMNPFFVSDDVVPYITVKDSVYIYSYDGYHDVYIVATGSVVVYFGTTVVAVYPRRYFVETMADLLKG